MWAAFLWRCIEDGQREGGAKDDRFRQETLLCYNSRERRDHMNIMNIRRAQEKDMPRIHALLAQVEDVHHRGRPDLFKSGARKYSDEQLATILTDDTRPVFVACDEEDQVLGYAFCIFQQHPDDNILTDIRTLYIDDLCVDEALRGAHIGKRLYAFVVDHAREQGCYNVTLNVWACNEAAMRFYESCGLRPQKIGMEKILDEG